MFLKVPNAIFDQGIKGNALKVYLYLLSCQNRLGTATVRIATIQTQCAIDSPDTVRSTLDLLEAKGLVYKSHRKNYDGNLIASRFDLTQLPGAWFALDMAARPFLLDKSAFAVYLLLMKICRPGQCGKQACPSLAVIAKILALAKNTVLAAITALINCGLIVKAAFWAGKHNLYILVQKHFSEKKVAAPKPLTAISEERRTIPKPILNIAQFGYTVNSSAIFLKQVVQKLGGSIKTYLFHLTKRRNKPIASLKGSGRSAPFFAPALALLHVMPAGFFFFG